MKDKTTVVLMVGAAAFVVAIAARLFMGSSREGFMQQEVGAPAKGGDEGVYAGIDISNGNSWSSVSAPTPLKSYEAADDDMQLFANQDSTFKPECCPNAISSDTGCLCMSASEEKKLAYRGGNRA
uniref:Uncharacterized protein n=1 Tax=viral metagenome TaxID=1070528 RepID=A0A6C0HKG8_9ZZZZ